MRALTIVKEEKVAYKQTGTVDQDGLWKKTISELFEDFLMFFVPDLAEQVDFERGVVPLDKELHEMLIENRQGKMEGDKIFQVQLKSGEKQLVFIHVEIQGSRSKEDFSRRMFRYFYRIYDQKKQCITAIAIMTAEGLHAEPFYYDFFGTTIHYSFNSSNIFSDFNEQMLEKSDNIISEIILAARAFHELRSEEKEQELFAFKKELMIKLYRSNYSNEQIETAIYFVEYLLYLPPILKRRLKDELRKTIREEGDDMAGLTKPREIPSLKEILETEWEGGKKEGSNETKHKIAHELLLEGMTPKKIAKITKLSLEEVEKIQSEMD